jgi:predicted transposase YdaD
VLKDRIEDVILLNTELKKEYIEDKHCILDVRAITDRGKIEGIKEGLKEGSISIAKKLISIGLSEENIIKATGLSKDEIKRIKEKIH